MLPSDLKEHTFPKLSFSKRLNRLADILCLMLTTLLIAMVFAVMILSFILAASLPVSEPTTKAAMEVQK
jgi:TRAP-type C4-dicarboxylate transport system permease small subunit